jgi:hypothetical protein
MYQRAITERPNDHNPLCTGILNRAEQELAAFFNAVTDLYGPHIADLSANDWLNELLTSEALPASTRDWRQITLNVSTRLAARVSALSLSRDSTRPHTDDVQEYSHSW